MKKTITISTSLIVILVIISILVLWIINGNNYNAPFIPDTPISKYEIVSMKAGILTIRDLNNNDDFNIKLTGNWDNTDDNWIVDTNKNMFSSSLTKIKDNTILFRWSSTQQYLFVDNSIKNQYILVDIGLKKEIKVPVDNYKNIQIWSSDDSKAIIESSSNQYLWDLRTNKTHEIESDYLGFTPNGEYVYYINVNSESNNYSFKRYNINDYTWKEYILKDSDIRLNTIKWISENEIAYISENENKSFIPWISYFQPNNYFANKLNLDNGNKKVVKLPGNRVDKVDWSKDNKFVRYNNQKNYTVYVGFDD